MSIAPDSLWLDLDGVGDSVWTDCAPRRPDLPRTLPEIPRLGLSAVDVAPPDRNGWLFRRTPRPPQGRLTEPPTVGLLLVLIAPKHDTDESARALRDWADFVHISHIAAAGVPGFTMITPYEIDEAQRDTKNPRYLHLYELDDPDPEARFAQMSTFVRARLDDDDEYKAWAFHSELRIDYVSTYALER
jgi:hypothetical protein